MTSPTAAIAFRTDLNGLRAVAVLTVLLFHFKVGPFGGGFIGVDVFFVISGFLMTQIIAGGLATGRFSLPRFYLNRLARIAPALLAVGAACLLVAYLSTSPKQFAAIARETLSAMTFRVNYLYAGDTSYFAPSATQRWLLHCWSLAVEFQFYILFPLLLMGAHKASRRAGPLALLVAIMALSAPWSYWQTATSPVEAFYLLPARAWEFALGGLVLFLPAPAPRARNTLAMAGLTIIFATALFYTERLAYPSLWAALPVSGAALVLFAQSDVVALSNRVAQYLGTVSYSLYLWHWPLLTIAHYFGYGQSAAHTAVLVLLTFILAHCSNRLIEAPFRDALRRLTWRRTAPLGFATLAVIGACLYINASGGWPQRMSPDLAELLDRASYRGEFRDGECFLQPNQAFSQFSATCFDPAPGSGKPKLAIWGSSHGAQLYSGIAKQEWAKQFDILQLTASACPPISVGTDPARPHCPGIQRGIRRFLEKAKPQIVLIAMSRFALTDGPANGASMPRSMLLETIRSLRAAGVARVVVAGPTPNWSIPLPQIYFRDSLFSNRHSDNLAAPVLPLEFAEIDRGMREATLEAGGTYISLRDAMCSGEQCRTTVPDWPDDVLMQFDENHLSVDASEWVAERTIGPALLMAPNQAIPTDLVTVNQTLAFSDKALGRRYLKNGWMASEPWGTWTVGAARPGILTLPVDRAHPPSALRIRFSGQLGDKLAVEHFTIKINRDEARRESILQANQTAERVLPISADAQAQMRQHGVLRVAFYAPEGKSPKALGLNDDERVLGLGLRELTLLP